MTANGAEPSETQAQAQAHGSAVDLDSVYQKGRMDAAAEFQAMIPLMGSQLYGEVNKRIEQNIGESADRERQQVMICASDIIARTIF